MLFTLLPPRPASPVCTLVSPTWNRTPSVRGILKPLRRTSSSASIPKAACTGKKVQFNEEPSVRVYNPEDSPDGTEQEEEAAPEPPRPFLARRRTGAARKVDWSAQLCCAYDAPRRDGLSSAGSSLWSDDEDDDVPVRPVLARQSTGPPRKVDWVAQVRPTEDESVVELPGKYPVMVPRAVFEAAVARCAEGMSPPAAKRGLKIDTGVAVTGTGASASKFGVVASKESQPEAPALARTSGSLTSQPLNLLRSRSRQLEEEAIEGVVRSSVFLRHHLEGPIPLRLENAVNDLDIDEMDVESCEELAKAVEQELEQHSAAAPPRGKLVEDHIEFLSALHKYITEKCEA